MSEYGYVVKMKCLTNMHVGDGEENYSIIDKMVERDPVTGYPIVNASGVKGALKEFCKNEYPDDTNTINDIFGNEDTQNKSTNPGQVKILAAEMLARSARASAGDNPFYLVTTDAAVNRFNFWCEVAKTAGIFRTKDTPCAVEGITVTSYYGCDNGETKLYRMGEDEFRDIPLPVLARNSLDNGKSKNLWYEEVVPYESIFYFPVFGTEELVNKLRTMIDNKIVQFGSGASIGYGLCKLSVLERSAE